MAIKFTQEFNKEIARIVQNYNRKIDRLSAKYPKAHNIPEKVTVRALKYAYNQKPDLQRRLNQLQTFNEDKLKKLVTVSSDNVKISDYDYNRIRLQQKVAKKRVESLLKKNQARDKREGRFLPSHRTRSLKAQLKTIEKGYGNRISWKSFLASSRVSDRYSERRAKSDQQFYENFFDMLWANQAYSELDPDLVEQAHNMFEQLTPEQLLEMYNSEPDVSRLVEDYTMYTDTQGYSATDEEIIRARVRFENLMEELPELIKKYSKM